jgi:pimeloyl-ACP methyl ester carboxylesterase
MVPPMGARGRRRWSGALLAAVASLVVPAVGGGRVAAAPLPALAPAPPITWSACPTQAGYRCGTVNVPVDYAEPNGPTVPVPVIEKPAADPAARRGVLLFNPGGPGESGVLILPVLAALVPKEVSDDFDLVSFDERGTGASDGLACGPSPAAAASVDPLPATPERPLPAVSLFHGLHADCSTAEPSLLPHLDSTDAARDMDRIRQALGVSKINYWGLSYGTVLGSVYAHLFPGRVRAMILDGAVVESSPLATGVRAEASALTTSLDHFFASCAAEPHCPLGSNPRGYYENLATDLARRPLPAPGNGDDLPVTLGDLDTATLFYLSVPSFGGMFTTALVAASAGNGAPLRALALEIEVDLDGASLVGPQWAIACNDTADRLSAAAAGRLARTLDDQHGQLAAYAVTYDLAGCTYWPRSSVAVRSVVSAAAHSIMVIGNTGDPNTPHSSAVQLAHALGGGHLVTWKGWGHTWLLNGSSDQCMDRVVDAYLISSQVPASGTTCA